MYRNINTVFSTPEATSLGRVSAFNRVTVRQFLTIWILCTEDMDLLTKKSCCLLLPILLHFYLLRNCIVLCVLNRTDLDTGPYLICNCVVLCVPNRTELETGPYLIYVRAFTILLFFSIKVAMLVIIIL